MNRLAQGGIFGQSVGAFDKRLIRPNRDTEVQPVYTSSIAAVKSKTLLQCFDDPTLFGSKGLGDAIRHLPSEFPAATKGEYASYQFPREMLVSDMIGCILKAPRNLHQRLILAGNCWTLPQTEHLAAMHLAGTRVGMCSDGTTNVFPVVSRQPEKCALFMLSGNGMFTPRVELLGYDLTMPKGTRLLLFNQGN